MQACYEVILTKCLLFCRADFSRVSPLTQGVVKSDLSSLYIEVACAALPCRDLLEREFRDDAIRTCTIRTS
jgi:hypothetical protein